MTLHFLRISRDTTHNHCIPLVLLLLLHVTICYSDGGIAVVTLQWSGGEPLESPCLAGIYMPSFACSYGQRGNWSDGIQSFQDPIPENSVLTNITAILFGTFSCSEGDPASAYLRIGNSLVNQDEAMLTSNLPCFSANCVGQYNISSTTSCFSNYAYGQINPFQIILTANQICLSKIVLVFTYSTATPFLGTISPALGPIGGGTQVTVHGYTPPAGEGTPISCLFNRIAVPALIIGSNTVCSAPSQNSSSVVTFYITSASVCDGETIAGPGPAFVYYVPPTVTSISPINGPPAGGTTITVVGQTFFNVSTIGCKIGQNTGIAEFINITHILCIAPAGLGSGLNLSLTFNDQQYTPTSFVFNYEDESKFWNPNTTSWVILGVSGLAAIGLIVLFIVLIKSRFKHDGYEQIIEGKQITIEEVRLGVRIGKGNFGEVYKAYWRGAEIAVKKLPAHNMTDQFLKDFHKEVSLMRALRHPNVIQFLGSCTILPDICICIEFMPRGSLYKILHDPSQTLTWALIKKMCTDAAKGCVYLHDCTPTIVHRDLKSHNLLVDENWKVKVCDFGLSTIVEQASRTLTACGTPCWTAPEVLRNQRYTEKADVYSFGIVLWECATREDPFVGMPPFQVIFAVGREGLRPPLPRICPPEFSKLITECWDEKPHVRPSMKDVLARLENIDTTGWPDVLIHNPSPIV